MSNLPGKCKWEHGGVECEQDATWDDTFCYLHRPPGGPGGAALGSWLLSLSKEVGIAIVADIILKLVEKIPAIHGLFSQRSDILNHLKNHETDRATFVAAVHLIDYAAEQDDQVRTEIVDKLLDYHSGKSNKGFKDKGGLASA